MRRSFLHLALALLLILTQQMATAHLVSHEASQLTQAAEKAKNATKLCLQCSAFSSIENSPPAVFHFAPLVAATHADFVSSCFELASRTEAVYRSRAPPAFV